MNLFTSCPFYWWNRDGTHRIIGKPSEPNSLRRNWVAGNEFEDWISHAGRSGSPSHGRSNRIPFQHTMIAGYRRFVRPSVETIPSIDPALTPLFVFAMKNVVDQGTGASRWNIGPCNDGLYPFCSFFFFYLFFFNQYLFPSFLSSFWCGGATVPSEMVDFPFIEIEMYCPGGLLNSIGLPNGLTKTQRRCVNPRKFDGSTPSRRNPLAWIFLVIKVKINFQWIWWTNKANGITGDRTGPTNSIQNQI